MNFVEALSARRAVMLRRTRLSLGFFSAAVLVAFVYWTPDGTKAGTFINVHLPYEVSHLARAAGAAVAGGDNLKFLGVRWYWVELLSSFARFLLWSACAFALLKRRPQKALTAAAFALLFAEATLIFPRWSGYLYAEETPETYAVIDKMTPNAEVSQGHIHYLLAQVAYLRSDIVETEAQLSAIRTKEMDHRQVSDWRINIMQDWVSSHGGIISSGAYQPALGDTEWRLGLSRLALAASLVSALLASMGSALYLILLRRERRIAAILSDSAALQARMRIAKCVAL